MKRQATKIELLKPPRADCNLLPVVEVNDLVIDKPSLVCVKMDSKSAEICLSLNTGNRWVRRRLVEYLKDQIKNGEWRGDHPQPIVFSREGRLIDGQHRLMAIAGAGLSADDAVMVRVETGADDNVREYLDTGAPRGLSDRVELVMDHRMNKVISQLCTHRHSLSSYGKSNRPSPEQAREIFEKHREAMLFVARYKRNDKGVGLISVASAAVEYYEIDPAKAEIFYPAIFVADSSCQQARILRDWLLRTIIFTAARRGSAAGQDVYARAVGCMKAHKEGREIKIVRAGQW